MTQLFPTQYQSFKELLEVCQEKQLPIWEVAVAFEAANSGSDTDTILSRMAALVQQMKDTIDSGVTSSEPSLSGLSGGDAKRLMDSMNTAKNLFFPLGTRLMAYGLATLEENSRMRKIVACPTAGGSGSVPAVLIALEDEGHITREKSTRGLITAGCIGELVSRRMRLSGSAAGCQAEVGVATGMAAGAMVEALGGTPEQVLHAASISMQNLMGLVCDPVAGLVEIPCVVRNGLAGVQAASAATMALAGVKSFIPLDEVVDAMAEVGKLMSPRLKESAEGGLAKTPTANAFTETFYAS
jgi:L-serine dehydratase